jgi:hypothetical protein
LGVLDRWSASSFVALILSGILWGGACLCIHYWVWETILGEYGKLCLQLSSPLWDLLKLFGDAIADQFFNLYRQWAGIKPDKKRAAEEETGVDGERTVLLPKPN